MNLLIRDARVIDPAQGIDERFDIEIEGERIKRVEKGIKENSSHKVIEARGKVVTPGFIDMHTHLREPGFEYKEDIISGSLSAIRGGYTTICAMANTDPVCDDRDKVAYIKERGKSAFCRIMAIGSVTKGQMGHELSHIGLMKEEGIVAISDDGKPVLDTGLFRRAMEYASSFDLLVISHCEDTYLSRDGLVNEGFISTKLGLAPIPKEAEEVMVARDIALAKLSGCHLHIAHISTKRSCEMVKEAKEKGIKVTCEVTPHHLFLTEEAVLDFNTNAKVNPPLREEEEVFALREFLCNGTIDVIATDHAPHALSEKQMEFGYAPFGIVGLETAFPLSLSLYFSEKIELLDLVAKFTSNPANILSLSDRGKIAQGYLADLTIIDLDKKWRFFVDESPSKGKNSPFDGKVFRGAIVMTIVGGKIVYKNM